MTEIDPKDYIIGPDTVIDTEIVETGSVMYRGEPLTQERVDELVERVHRNLTPGGKSLSRDGSKSKPIQILLPNDTREELVSRANAAGKSVSKYTRELIERTLKAS